MTCRLWNRETDYSSLVTWWTARAVPPPPVNLLPDTGILVEDDTDTLAAVWCYLDSSRALGLISYPSTRPALPPRRAAAALGLAVDFLESYLPTLGIPYVSAYLSAGSLNRFFERRGYATSLADHVHCMKLL